MDDSKAGYQATPSATLEQQMMDACAPKNERERWASAEVTRLRAEVEEGDRQSKIMLDSYADENQRISDERDRLRAEVAALRADSETKRSLLLWALYHAQGGSSPVGQPIRRHLGIEQHAHLTLDQIQDAARAAQGDN